jgi:hypothetical protein
MELGDHAGEGIADARNFGEPALGDQPLQRQRTERQVVGGTAIGMGAIEIIACQFQSLSQLAKEIAFLSGILCHGPMPEKEVRARAEAAGLSSRTVDWAKHLLGVNSKKIGLKGWAWHLPASMTVEERQDA